MAISRFSTSRVGAGLPKYQKFWDGSTVYTPPSFYSIQTATVDSGGTTSIEFTSIPDTYKHLQLRFIARNDTGISGLIIRFNSDTSSSYARHRLTGDGSSAAAGAGTSITYGEILSQSGIPSATSTFAVSVLDILDYTNTNKYKTVRSLSGYDSNGAGGIALESDLWMNTNAISSIYIANNTNNFAQYSQFALYGIKA